MSIYEPPHAIGPVPSFSGRAIAYRWRSLPRVRRHRASKPQGSSERVLPWQVTMDQLIFASLSHTHYWYKVGMLKVPAVVVVVAVDSHVQRIVLATEETTVTQQVSHRPIKCQSRLWSQRGTKVNGSHHGDKPLLTPTGIQIATKRYATLQAMAPTNIKTVHQTSQVVVVHSIRCQEKRNRRLLLQISDAPIYADVADGSYDGPARFTVVVLSITSII